MNSLLRYILIGVVLLPPSTAFAQIKVFACEPEWAELSKELGGDQVKVYSATHARQDPHHIQARPSLIARLRSADLAVCTGAELEVGWMPMLQRRARNPDVLPGKPGYFEATDHVSLLEVPDQLDRAEGDVHADGNPHIQLDPRRILQVAETLTQRLQLIDPAHAQDYQKSWETFKERWGESLIHWQHKAQPLQGKQAIVHHREWVYLLDWLGIERIGSLEPNPGVPPTPSHLAKLKELEKPAFIITSPLNDSKPADWLHEQNGAPVVTLPHTVGAVDDSDDLFTFFERIVERLAATQK